MNNDADFITGDDMIALLLSEGGDESATYAPGDYSREAVIARTGEFFARIVNPDRGSVIEAGNLYGRNGEMLESFGLVAYGPVLGRSSAYYYLTDAGAALARSLKN